MFAFYEFVLNIYMPLKIFIFIYIQQHTFPTNSFLTLCYIFVKFDLLALYNLLLFLVRFWKHFVCLLCILTWKSPKNTQKVGTIDAPWRTAILPCRGYRMSFFGPSTGYLTIVISGPILKFFCLVFMFFNLINTIRHS